MSHFTVGVVVPTGLDSLEDYLDTALAPFSEHLEVEPYPHECWCINGEARSYGLEMANKLVGTVDEQRKLFTERHANDDRPWSMEVRNELFKVETADWWQSYVETQDDYETYHPRFLKPNNHCGNCNGSGSYQSTYNPLSKWDYWDIGGQRAGKFNGRDVAPIADIIDLHSDIPFYAPFAMLTPDGQWHERGEMGWWAMVSNEKQQEHWESIVRGLYEQHTDYLLVIVDAHI